MSSSDDNLSLLVHLSIFIIFLCNNNMDNVWLHQLFKLNAQCPSNRLHLRHESMWINEKNEGIPISQVVGRQLPCEPRTSVPLKFSALWNLNLIGYRKSNLSRHLAKKSIILMPSNMLCNLSAFDFTICYYDTEVSPSSNGESKNASLFSLHRCISATYF
jgi:hypothetical protein